MKLNKRRIFNLISFIFLGSLLCFYGYRLIHYYRLENKPANNNEVKYLSDMVIADHYPSSFLVKKDNEYLFHDSNPENYLVYSGLLWRIVKINSDNQIIMVLEDTNIELSYNDDYKDSDINIWLNKNTSDNSGVFYRQLNDQESYLTKTNICLNVIDDLENITCENINSDYNVGILSLNDYVLVGGSTSYLNNHTNWWTSSIDANNNKWYITNEGEISKTTTNKNYGVRPVITLDKEIVYLNGKGTKENPYIIEEEQEDVLNQKLVGSYINYSGHLWRIVGQEDHGTKVVMDGYLKVDNEEVIKKYSNGSNIFSLKSTNIGGYLNNKFYETLENKDYIVESKWYIGTYSVNNGYHYQDIYEDYVTANIGLLNIADLFVNEYPNTYTITGTTTGEETVYTIDSNHELYRDFPTKELKMRPSLYLDANLIIKDGKGTADAPYEIEG